MMHAWALKPSKTNIVWTQALYHNVKEFSSHVQIMKNAKIMYSQLMPYITI